MISCVISGDIVKSQRISTQAYEQVLYELSQFGLWVQSRYQANFSQFRGDEFQISSADFTHIFHMALLCRLRLRSIQQDARLSLAIARQEPPRADNRTATGAAFTLSGQGLDAMSQQRLHFAADKTIPAPLQLLLRFCDAHITQMSARQAQAMTLYLTEADNSHHAIAQLLGTSRVNVTKLLNQANYTLLDDFLTQCQHIISELYS